MPVKFALPRGYVKWLIAGLIVLALGWYVFLRDGNSSLQTLTVRSSTFAQQVSVSGTVQAAQDVDLGFAASGRISGVYASVGQQVTAGTLLAQIENGDLRATFAQKQAALAAQQADLASVQAGTRPEQIAVTEAQIASDQSALTQANSAIADAIQTAYTQSDDAVHNKVDQFFSNARSSSPSLAFSVSNSQYATTLVNERVSAEGLLASWQSGVAASAAHLASAIAEAQANLATVMTLLSDANAALNTAVPSTQTPQSTLNAYIAAVGTARANVNTASAALTTAVSNASAAASALAKDQKTRALEQAGATPDDIASQQAQVAAAQAEVQNAEAQLEKTLVVAPFTGVVTRMDAKVGQIISPSVPEISLISKGLFQIRTFVPEVEIVGLAVGNAATTTLDAYGASVVFPAKVIAIDPAETMQNGVATYKTTLQFLASDPRIKSGMTATVVITTKAVPDALAVPQGAVFQKNGRQLLQLVRDGSIADVPVTLGGASAIGNVQITSGLADGDTVVLNPDTAR